MESAHPLRVPELVEGLPFFAGQRLKSALRHRPAGRQGYGVVFLNLNSSCSSLARQQELDSRFRGIPLRKPKMWLLDEELPARRQPACCPLGLALARLRWRSASGAAPGAAPLRLQLRLHCLDFSHALEIEQVDFEQQGRIGGELVALGFSTVAELG